MARRKEVLLRVAKIAKHSGLFVLACKSYAAVSFFLHLGRRACESYESSNSSWR